MSPEKLKLFKRSRNRNYRKKLSIESIESENETCYPIEMKNYSVKKRRRSSRSLSPKPSSSNFRDQRSGTYQIITQEVLKETICRLLMKINKNNIKQIADEFLKKNIKENIRLFVYGILEAQIASVTLTQVYAALIAIINPNIPDVGKQLINHLIIKYKRAHKENNKHLCESLAMFILHLTNRKVCHESLILEILNLQLVKNPTEDSIEVATSILMRIKSTEIFYKKKEEIFQILRTIPDEVYVDKKIRFSIEVLFYQISYNFKDSLTFDKVLDLEKIENQITHQIHLDNQLHDKYVSDCINATSEHGSKGDQDDNDKNKAKAIIINNDIERSSIALRRAIYFKIHSTSCPENCIIRLLSLKLKCGLELDLCQTIVDISAEKKTYEDFYGIISQRLCTINKIYVRSYEKIFNSSFKTIHRLNENQSKNTAKLFSYLLSTRSISWKILSKIILNKDDPNSESMIFIRILFEDLQKDMGPMLESKLQREKLQETFKTFTK